MPKKIKTINHRGFFYWFPRIAGIVFIAFISIFALDIFGNGYTFWQTVAGLSLHLIPSFVLTAILIVSWKNDLVGAIVFIVAAFGYMIISLDKLPGSLIIGLPALAVGIIFLVNRYRIKKTKQ